MRIYNLLTISLLIGAAPVLAETTPSKSGDVKIEKLEPVKSSDSKNSEIAIGVPIDLDQKKDKLDDPLKSTGSIEGDALHKSDTASIGFKADDIEKIVIKVIQEKPEILVNALQTYGERQQAEHQKIMQESLVKFKDKLLDASGASVLGDTTSGAKVVVFVDPICPHCRVFEMAMHKVHEKFPKVAFFVRHWAILGDESKQISRVMVAAELQGKFERLSKTLSALEDAPSYEKIISIAKSQGLDMSRLNEDLKSDKVKKVLEDTDTLAKSIELRGTPTVIISDKSGIRIANLTDENSLSKLIEEATSTLGGKEDEKQPAIKAVAAKEPTQKEPAKAS